MTAAPKKPEFDASFRDQLDDLLEWRRDVRRFRTDPVPDEIIEHALQVACNGPSVGNCQPWRYVLVDNKAMRKAVRENFQTANAEALNDYSGEQAGLYASLKLAGLDQAPVHLAAFADTKNEAGYGLGAKTMPETKAYSVVAAIQCIWLVLRAQGVGMGWLSILDPDAVKKTLEVPDDWTFVGYFCIGYPEEEHHRPELERFGWQDQLDADKFIQRK